MVDPAGMWPGAGSGPDGRRLATHARLASTALLPVSAAFPVTTPAGSGSAPTTVVMECGGATVPHAVRSNASREMVAQRTLSPYLVTRDESSKNGRFTCGATRPLRAGALLARPFCREGET